MNLDVQLLLILDALKIISRFIILLFVTFLFLVFYFFIPLVFSFAVFLFLVYRWGALFFVLRKKIKKFEKTLDNS